jgi:hypothetical protein
MSIRFLSSLLSSVRKDQNDIVGRHKFPFPFVGAVLSSNYDPVDFNLGIRIRLECFNSGNDTIHTFE